MFSIQRRSLSVPADLIKSQLEGLISDRNLFCFVSLFFYSTLPTFFEHLASNYADSIVNWFSLNFQTTYWCRSVCKCILQVFVLQQLGQKHPATCNFIKGFVQFHHWRLHVKYNTWTTGPWTEASKYGPGPWTPFQGPSCWTLFLLPLKLAAIKDYGCALSLWYAVCCWNHYLCE